MNGESSETQEAEAQNRRWEPYLAGALAIFASVLAINELGAGKYGEDELKLSNEKTSTYLWYQSKGIKEGIAEGQRDLLRSFSEGGMIRAEVKERVDKLAVDLDTRVERYKKERKEILLGSKTVGEKNWAQEVDGQLGRVVGAKEIEASIELLSRAGDRFDAATLALQLCLVAGALGLLVRRPHLRVVFFVATLVLGATGAAFSVGAFYLVG